MSIESALIEGRQAHKHGLFLHDNPYGDGAYVKRNLWETGWIEGYQIAYWKLLKKQSGKPGRRPGWAKPQWRESHES